jgi:hypothetical protein
MFSSLPASNPPLGSRFVFHLSGPICIASKRLRSNGYPPSSLFLYLQAFSTKSELILFLQPTLLRLTPHSTTLFLIPRNGLAVPSKSVNDSWQWETKTATSPYRNKPHSMKGTSSAFSGRKPKPPASVLIGRLKHWFSEHSESLIANLNREWCLWTSPHICLLRSQAWPTRFDWSRTTCSRRLLPLLKIILFKGYPPLALPFNIERILY